MACGLSTEMELELESIGFWGETITGIPGEKTLGADLLKKPTANSTHTASTRLTFRMQVNLPGIEFLGTKPKLRKRKRNSSKCAYVPRIIHKTSREGISRCTRAVTSKKCTKKVRCTYRVVVSGLFCFCFCLFFFCKSRLRYRRLIAVPDEFLTGWKLCAATSLTQNRSIFCSVHTDLEQLRVYKFLRLRWFRVGTEHLNAQVFSRSKTRPVPCERSLNNFACWIFFLHNQYYRSIIFWSKLFNLGWFSISFVY